MQIHELNTFSGSPTASDYLAVDNGTETTKLPMSNVGIAMTQAEAEAGTVTVKRTIAPNIFKAAVLAITKAMAPYVTEQGTSGAWAYRKWSNGTVEAWYSEAINQSYAFTTHSGSNYYYTNNDWTAKIITVPTGVFSNIIDGAFVNIQCNGYLSASCVSSSLTSIGVRAFTPYSININITKLSLYVVGA